MTIGSGETGQEINLQKVTPGNCLLQHFDHIRVPLETERFMQLKKPDAHRIETGQ